MKKYLIAILCVLIFTVTIGWAADTFDRYRYQEQLSQSKRIQSLESRVKDLEDQVQGLEDGLKMLQLRVQEIAIELQRSHKIK